MINANEANALSNMSYEERRRADIEERWNKAITNAARAGYHSVGAMIRLNDEELMVKILEENGYQVVVKEINPTEYHFEVCW